MAGTCTDPYPDKLFRAQIADNGDKPVVAAGPAFRPDPDFPPGKVELIVYQNQIGRTQTVLRHEWLERSPAQIHIGLRLGQDYFRTHSYDGLGIKAPDRNVPFGCEPVNDKKAQVMRRKLI